MMHASAALLHLPAAFAGVLGQANRATTAATEAAEATGVAGWQVVLVFMAIVGLPFLLGWLIAKALRLPDTRMRIGLVLFVTAIGLAPFVLSIVTGTRAGLSVTESLRQSIKLGVDLAGGTNLVYQVIETREKPLNNQILDNMVGAIVQRINPSGTEEVTVRRVGRDRIEVIVPGADPEKVRRIKRRIVQLGSLEFDLLANNVDHRQWIAEARELPGTEQNIYQGGQIIASWKNVARDVKGNWKLGNADAVRYVDANGQIVPTAPEEGTAGVEMQALVILEKPEQRVTGEYVRSASPSQDESGRPSVAFNFNSKGGQLFLRLTGANLPAANGFQRQLAILLDDQIHSAPSILGPIGNTGSITGEFTQEEVRELVRVLNAGALEVPINPEPASEFTISPLLGDDTIRKAVTAILWAGIAVLAITAAYYLIAGLVADFCLMLNLILLLGLMSLIDATFTLPGLAGVVLTFGMAVDANVLIYERMREEFARGSSFRVAIQNGFDRALSAIVDSNVTTLITAVILYLIGTDAVRGFAVSLFIGIVVSMFTALYVARLILEIMDRKRWVRKLHMNAVFTNPQVDWFKHLGLWVALSLTLLVVGIAALFYRGSRMLDIDFLGGTMVTFQLDEKATAGQIRDLLSSVPEFQGNISVERLVLQGEESGEDGHRFRIRTTMQDPNTYRHSESMEEAEAAAPAEDQATVAQLVAEALSAGNLEIRRVGIAVDPAGPIAEANTQPTFQEGSSANVTITESNTGEQEEFGTDTIEALVHEELQDIEVDGRPKYLEIRELIQATGLAGTGLKASGTEAKTFSAFRLDVAPQISREDFNAALTSLKTRLTNEPIFDEVNSFDSAVAGETQQAAIMAILASWVAMIAYLWIRFQDIAYGLAAVIGIVHDILISLGLLAIASIFAADFGIHWLAIEEFKINLPLVAAVMTLIGYSVNDTIVVFDRIREVRGKSPSLSREMVNMSLNQTLSRTLLTSVTTLIVTTVLYFFGGEGIHGFTFIITIGIIVGTFSSIFISAPLLIWLVNRKLRNAPATQRPRQPVTTAP